MNLFTSDISVLPLFLENLRIQYTVSIRIAYFNKPGLPL